MTLVDAPSNPMVGEVAFFRDAFAGHDIAADQEATSRTLRLVDALLDLPLS